MDNIIVLKDESGKEVLFEFLDLIEHEGDEYVILLPADDTEESGEVLILRLESDDENDGDECYSGVHDEETLRIIFDIFREKFKDEFDFGDE